MGNILDYLNQLNPFSWNWSRSRTLPTIGEDGKILSYTSNKSPYTAGDFMYDAFSPRGEGKNAKSYAEIGLGGLGLAAQYQQNKDNLALSRDYLNWEKSNALTNAINQATIPAFKLNNLLNAQIGFHGENSAEAKNAYANTHAALTQMNNALTNIGGQDSLRPQMDVLQRYSSLA